MQQGQIAELGKHNELLAKEGLYARLYAMNFQDEDEETAASPQEGQRAST